MIKLWKLLLFLFVISVILTAGKCADNRAKKQLASENYNISQVELFCGQHGITLKEFVDSSFHRQMYDESSYKIN